MKRIIAAIALLLMLPCLCACSGQEKLVYPVSYHYLRTQDTPGQIHHGSDDSVIAAELREGSGYQNNQEYLLDIYLLGPLDRQFRSPFPVGTALRELTLTDGTATVLLSSHFGSLTGIDLTVACSCLTLTVMDLTGAESVTILAQNSLLDGKESITMDRSMLLLTDDTTPETD